MKFWPLVEPPFTVLCLGWLCISNVGAIESYVQYSRVQGSVKYSQVVSNQNCLKLSYHKRYALLAICFGAYLLRYLQPRSITRNAGAGILVA
jgi:hypothetical protein